jgi:methylisocitrate lyase
VPTSAPTPGRRLRDAFSAGPVAVPGVFCPLVARLAQRIGYQAVYLSGAALSAGLGLPDIGLVNQVEFTAAAQAITQACTLPLLCDADTGFGEALSIERTVRLYESAGAAGLHLEDQVLPKRCGHLSGKGLVDARVMETKVKAAVAARVDPDFLVIARTDARGVAGLDEALRRAEGYVKAGADAIFPEALQNREEFETFAQALPGVPLVANMTEFGQSPNLDLAELGALGYRLVLYPVTVFRVALKAAEDALKEIVARGHQRELLGRMFTRQELYDALDYRGYEERDRTYFG